MVDKSTARERYESLMRTGEWWAQAGDENNVGGPTYWNKRTVETQVALMEDSIGTPLSDDEISRHKVSREARAALYCAFERHKQAIWRTAGEILKLQAAKLKAELVKEAQETMAIAEKLGTE